MNENKNYGIIREQGEYMEPVPLTPKDNATINEANRSTNNNNKK